MNSWSGILDLSATIGVALLTEFVTKPGKSELYNGWNKFYKAETCQETAQGFGESLQFMFSYTAQPQDYTNQLP